MTAVLTPRGSTSAVYFCHLVWKSQLNPALSEARRLKSRTDFSCNGGKEQLRERGSVALLNKGQC